jgi:LysM repeat protein
MYNITISQLRLWNNLQETEGIKVGQTLQVSASSGTNQATTMPLASEFEEYTVQSGDTLYKIAKVYAVTVQDLQEWNEKKESQCSHRGEVED